MARATPTVPTPIGVHARRASWLLQLVAAVILGQTLYFKFSGAAESVALFTTLGVEPWGRIGLGIVELVAVALLLRERTALAGALVALGLMLGAIGSHLALLGIEVGGDGGLLFGLACATFAASGGIVALRRGELAPLARRVLALAGR
jgi:hypothetical protein